MIGDAEREYLRQMLRLEADDDASPFLDLRQQFLKLPTGNEKQSTASSVEIENPDWSPLEAIAELKRVREGIWESDEAELSNTLRLLMAHAVPEVSLAAERMNAILQQRSKIEELNLLWNRPRWFSRAATENMFLTDLKRIWSMNPRSAAGMRETRTRAMWRNELPGYYYQSARRLLIHHPQIADLDREWIEEVALFPKADGYQPASKGVRRYLKLFGVALFVTIVFVAVVSIAVAIAT